MDEDRRRHYLAAMGIRLWRLREPGPTRLAGLSPAAHPDALEPPATEPAARPVLEAVPEARSSPARSAAPLPPSGPDAQNTAPSMRGTSPDPEARSEAGPVATPPGDDEPPPWTDADLTGLPMDDAQSVPDWGPADAEVTTPAEEANPVARLGWDALERAVAGCRACRLCERRTNTVFGVGDRNADLMLIGEGPGQDEDRQGEPFVGRAGQLLNRMLAAVGLRREQVYIANVVKCRPPGNRNPQPDEAAACRPYLARQIELVAPRLIVSLGGVSAQNLLDSTESVGRLRGRVHHYGPDRIPLLVTYHPSYYLRSPAEKAKGWQDLQRMIRLLNGEDAG